LIPPDVSYSFTAASANVYTFELRS
jgi:hypothetical protein